MSVARRGIPRRMSPSTPKGPHLLLGFFSDLPDPRVERTRLHPLLTVVVLAVLGVLCGAEGWDDLHAFGEAKATWLATFLDLQEGIPSADTFRRVFEMLQPKAFAACFQRFVDTLAQTRAARADTKHIAIDGKTLRHSFDTATGRSALHLVHAWCVEQHVLLGQLATDAKSNEITILPALLDMLDLKGATVTIDAMGCQKRVAAKILAGGGSYVLTLKDNHPTLRAEVEALFERDRQKGSHAMASTFFEPHRGHGRQEGRFGRALAVPDDLQGREEWAGLTSVVCVESVRMTQGVRTEERRYYLSSHPPDAETLARLIRGHWSIENELHWSLDVAFSEDSSRIRAGNGAENYALMRRVALMLLKRFTEVKRGIKAKQKIASWSNDVLLAVLMTGLGTEDATS